MPDLSMAYYDTFAIYDACLRQLEIHAVDSFGESRSVQLARRETFRQTINRPLIRDDGRPLIAGKIQVEYTPDEYCRAARA